MAEETPEDQRHRVAQVLLSAFPNPGVGNSLAQMYRDQAEGMELKANPPM